ncbi:MAG: tricarballylate utilization 4Fe-4S protein TcuB [Thermodesulfobacteriota bacterium]
MPSPEILKETEWTMTVCNACRYCEGFCAVFPAMELRRIFSEPDLIYLANLCHNCRGCYYACQYAPPHEFAVNVPKTFGRLRLEIYRELAWPRFMAGLFRRNGLAVALITLVSVAAVLLLTLAGREPAVVFAVHSGRDAFYRVIPYWLMVLPLSALGLGVLAALIQSGLAYWRKTGGDLPELLKLWPHLKAVGDVLRLRYLAGGGHGCNYPDEAFSMLRRWLHHLVFYGFLLCFTSTAIAFLYEHWLDLSAPYPLWSWPVALGASGGVGLLIGTGGLLYLKSRMDRTPAAPLALGMDVGFLASLFLTGLTGLLLLILRETPAMGVLLALHIGVVVGLFITIPYGKFVHGLYRYAALVRNAIEQSRGKI